MGLRSHELASLVFIQLRHVVAIDKSDESNDTGVIRSKISTFVQHPPVLGVTERSPHSVGTRLDMLGSDNVSIFELSEQAPSSPNSEDPRFVCD